jgi:para-nitrobenzyl esterase
MTSTETTEMKKTRIIETKAGKIQGYIEEGVEIFKGIPYAEPPLGELRFKPPVDKKPWDDVLDASSYGFCAYQGYTPLEDWFGKLEPESEDCLSLNVWTPAADDKKRAVMMWVHGGAFIMGSGIDPMYEGSYLAKRGDIVVVTINYRLGSFGYLYVPGSTVNIGMLDQVAALRWIRDNIAAFGGDPDTVTIFGESAGAQSVCTLPAMPAAKGLFHRIIAQSAPPFNPDKSDKISKNIMRQVGIKKGDLDGFRKIPAEKIIKAQNDVFAKDPTNILALRPLLDDETIPLHPLRVFKKGDCKDIDFMIGTNSEEFKMFLAMPQFSGMDDEALEKMLIGYLSMNGVDMNKAKELLELYKKEDADSDLRDILTTLVTDMSFRISTIHYLEAQGKHQPNTFNYLFTMKCPLLDGKLGACHALELPYVFGTINLPKMDEFAGKGAVVEAVSEKMMDAWIAFARTGNPNNDGIPDWPAYEPGKRSTMVFGPDIKVVEKYLDKQREAWGDTFNF